MAETTFSRKLDSSGRIMIPVRIREQVGLVSGKEYYFSIKEENGRRYVCIDCGSVDSELEKAMQIVQENGFKVVQDAD